jgi:hypothetical protein
VENNIEVVPQVVTVLARFAEFIESLKVEFLTQSSLVSVVVQT